jgi:hypothetical protein
MAVLRRIFFDFDQTISRTHVFKLLAGWDKNISVQAPFAHTDRGQISKIAELNDMGPQWAYDETHHGIVAAQTEGVRWTSAALGGAERVDMLRSFFSDIRAEGVAMTIVTKGYVGAVRKLLSEEELLDNFDSVIGFIGNFYCRSSSSAYDDACEISSMEGAEDSELKESKAAYITRVLQRDKLKSSQAILVEDDELQVDSVIRPGICKAVFVKDQRGMMVDEMKKLREELSPESHGFGPHDHSSILSSNGLFACMPNVVDFLNSIFCSSVLSRRSSEAIFAIRKQSSSA